MDGVCTPNIGPAERRKRLLFGVGLFAACAVIAAALIVAHANRWWRLVLFVPLWMAASGVFQAREKT